MSRWQTTITLPNKRSCKTIKRKHIRQRKHIQRVNKVSTLLMAKGNTSTAKGKGSTRTTLKKLAPKKAPPKKGLTKKKGPQKRAAEDSSSEDESDDDSESDHRPWKRKRAKKDHSDPEVVEKNEPEEEHEPLANDDGHNSPNDSEVRIHPFHCGISTLTLFFSTKRNSSRLFSIPVSN